MIASLYQRGSLMIWVLYKVRFSPAHPRAPAPGRCGGRVYCPSQALHKIIEVLLALTPSQDREDRRRLLLWIQPNRVRGAGDEVALIGDEFMELIGFVRLDARGAQRDG